MAFISKLEFSGTISTTIINTLTSNIDAVVDYWVQNSVDLMKSYLRNNYELSADTIFTASGANRSTLLMSYCKDLTIYNLYAMNNIFRKIPAIRVDRYNAAITWLEAVQDEKIAPAFTGTGATGYTHVVAYGSNTALENYLT